MAAGSTTSYQILKLLNQEFTFDVDVSNLPCGLNGALYLAQMDADGGMARWSGNKAGAKYGTGYCDAQCPQDIKFIDGVVSHYSKSLRSVTNSLRPTQSDGTRQRMMSMPALGSTDRAVLKWISGKQTQSPRPIPLTPAPSPSRLAAAEPTVELVHDTRPSVMLMDATSTPTVWVTLTSTGLQRQSTPPKSSLL